MLLVEQLQRLHTKRLMVRFDGTESQDEAQIEEKTHEITAKFRHAEKILKQFANLKAQSSEERLQQNVQRGLATQLQQLSVEFRKSQKEYLSRVKKQKQGPAEFDFLSQPTKSRTSDFGQTQMSAVSMAEDLIAERDAEILQITESIEELASIFKELAVLVIDQGSVLDRIDYNMEQVIERTEKGLQELERAERTQESSRPMKCIGTLLGLICLMTLILLLKHVH